MPTATATNRKPVSSLPFPISRVNTSNQLLILGIIPDSGISFVPTLMDESIWICPPSCHSFIKNAIRPEMAIAFNIIVEITSLTPLVTFKTPAMPEYAPPTTIATISISAM